MIKISPRVKNLLEMGMQGKVYLEEFFYIKLLYN
jgi:hypothetical protein